MVLSSSPALKSDCRALFRSKLVSLDAGAMTPVTLALLVVVAAMSKRYYQVKSKMVYLYESKDKQIICAQIGQEKTLEKEILSWRHRAIVAWSHVKLPFPLANVAPTYFALPRDGTRANVVFG